MRLIPVIDLQAGLVVRGVAGERSRYSPIQSVLCDGSDPETIARAFQQQVSCRQVYVADLDAIGGAAPALDDYTRIGRHCPALLIDAGLADIERAESLLRWLGDHAADDSAIVAGLETLPNEQTLIDLLGLAGPQRLIFSLDLKHGRPLTSTDAWQGSTAWEIAQAAVGCGVERMIVLDLAQVGVDQGPSTSDLCARLRTVDERLEIVTGGGIRGVDDLRHLAGLGVDGVLVASALHDGRLTRADAETVSS